MEILVYGGSFNPPHLGHVKAAEEAYAAIKPEKLLVIPTSDPPHKILEQGSPNAMERLMLTQLAFSAMPEAIVSDIEVVRGGASYTYQTVASIKQQYKGSTVTLLIGTDMLLYFEKWREFERLLQEVKLAVLAREEGEDEKIVAHAKYLRERYAADIEFISTEPLPMSSSEIRDELRNRQGVEHLDAAVYERIISKRHYKAAPNFKWLRERAYKMHAEGRIRHVAGCEKAAVSLAERWGADVNLAAEAGILHDITKKLGAREQLIICEEYGIIIDSVERENYKLLHAKTGAVLARALFGVCDEVYEAIWWHTTGRANMSLLEKILYLADYIEETRTFAEVTELRALSYSDIDAAMGLGIQLSVEGVRRSGGKLHKNSIEALSYYGKEE